MPTSDDEIDIGSCKAGSPQFDRFRSKLKLHINHWINQIDDALVIVQQSKKKACEIYYKRFKEDLSSYLSKCDRAWNFDALSSYEFYANKIKNEYLNHHAAFLYELRLSQHKKN